MTLICALLNTFLFFQYYGHSLLCVICYHSCYPLAYRATSLGRRTNKTILLLHHSLTLVVRSRWSIIDARHRHLERTRVSKYVIVVHIIHYTCRARIHKKGFTFHRLDSVLGPVKMGSMVGHNAQSPRAHPPTSFVDRSKSTWHATFLRGTFRIVLIMPNFSVISNKLLLSHSSWPRWRSVRVACDSSRFFSPISRFPTPLNHDAVLNFHYKRRPRAVRLPAALTSHKYIIMTRFC